MPCVRSAPSSDCERGTHAKVLLAYGGSQMSPTRAKPVSNATPAQQDAAIAAMIAGRSTRVVAWVRELRALVRRAAPGASERGIPGWRIVAYEAPRIFAYLVPLADSVALGFNRGSELTDADGVLERVGKASGARRYVIRAEGDWKPRVIERFVREAYVLEQATPVPPKPIKKPRRR